MPDELNIDELNEDEQAMVELVRDFVNREVRPVVRELEHANTYPDKLIEQMKQLGIYGLAIPAHAGISIILAEPGPGFTVSRDLPKLGYKGVESCELSFEDYRVPASALLGGREGEGFGQMMRGLEIGRIQVASRALGVGQAALDDSLRYAQEREAFGQPIWKHQSIGNYLADMVTKLTAARQLVMYAARCYDSGRRADMEVGMAKLFASETAMEIALNAVRIHGGYGYSTEFDVERYFRDAPLMIVGEGTNEIQRNVIARQLIQRNPAGA